MVRAREKVAECAAIIGICYSFVIIVATVIAIQTGLNLVVALIGVTVTVWAGLWRFDGLRASLFSLVASIRGG